MRAARQDGKHRRGIAALCALGCVAAALAGTPSLAAATPPAVDEYDLDLPDDDSGAPSSASTSGSDTPAPSGASADTSPAPASDAPGVDADEGDQAVESGGADRKRNDDPEAEKPAKHRDSSASDSDEELSPVASISDGGGPPTALIGVLALTGVVIVLALLRLRRYARDGTPEPAGGAAGSHG